MPNKEKAPSVLAQLNAGPQKKIAKQKKVKQARPQTAVVMPRPSRNKAKVPLPRYFVNPVFTARTDPTEGGAHMTVVIGPGQGELGNYGSVPQANTPVTMRRLHDDYPSFGWVAGHLLNDNLGGPGEAYNLTPLTTAGNKNHLVGIEAKIKIAIDRSYSRTVYYADDKFWYGVAYEVRVKDMPWPGMPVFVPTHLVVSAKCVRQHKSTGAIEDTPATDPAAQSHYFGPVADLEIENTGFIAAPVVGASSSSTPPSV
jgi:hypothetical protein